MHDGLYFKLVDREVVPCSCEEWAEWYESEARIVRHTKISYGDKSILVSTVFLSLVHPNNMQFETMVFEGPLNDECERYQTYLEAEMGHEIMVMRVKRKTELE